MSQKKFKAFKGKNRNVVQILSYQNSLGMIESAENVIYVEKIISPPITRTKAHCIMVVDFQYANGSIEAS